MAPVTGMLCIWLIWASVASASLSGWHHTARRIGEEPEATPPPGVETEAVKQDDEMGPADDDEGSKGPDDEGEDPTVDEGPGPDDVQGDGVPDFDDAGDVPPEGPADGPDPGAGSGKGSGKGKGSGPIEVGTSHGPPGEYNPTCDDPNDPDYDPSDPKCMGDFEEEEYEEYEDMPEEVIGDNEDNMAEEMSDVDDGPSFEDFDANADDCIDVNEAAMYGTQNGIPMGEVDAIYDYINVDKDECITREEWAMPGPQEATEDMAPDHGDLDLNGDGVLEMEEWFYACVCSDDNYLDTCGDEDQCKEIFIKADDDEDDVLTKEEFDGAGAECKTADDGNCEFFAVDKKPSKVSLKKWLRHHFQGKARNLFAIAKLRAQHLKGKYVKLIGLIAERHLALQRQRHLASLKAKKAQLLKQKGHRGKERQVHHLRQRGHQASQPHLPKRANLRQRGRRIHKHQHAIHQ